MVRQKPELKFPVSADGRRLRTMLSPDALRGSVSAPGWDGFRSGGDTEANSYWRFSHNYQGKVSTHVVVAEDRVALSEDVDTTERCPLQH